ncbi:hypothetical protein O181_033666 [Austropuccinia psidii MF-1]|uniref:Uncharacterized protein n=1 Tax=Austropuccinia psidii MF-1 TaxID=1389203 RepID=A0A9Q3CZ68_9BASI|nr:hypothetical protein [Austropuccinia psidii MF-1]
MVLVTSRNECFIQVGFRKLHLHMLLPSCAPAPAHNTSQAPAPTHDTAQAPTPANDTSQAPAPTHDTAQASAPAHTHANSGSTFVTCKWSIPLHISPSHALPLCASGT